MLKLFHEKPLVVLDQFNVGMIYAFG